MPSIADLIPESALPFVNVSGRDLADRIGTDELKGIVAGVLCGENVRSATEPLTRRRIAALNAAVLITMAKISNIMSPDEMIEKCHQEVIGLSANDPRRKILTWFLGLTGKQIQNVLRSNDDAWSDFIHASKEAMEDTVSACRDTYGMLEINVRIGDIESSAWDWLWAHSLMIAVGSQSLATRGSEKSIYGKFFEKLILGSVLDVLGFSFDPGRSGNPMTFWLSHRGEKRESDATAIVSEGNGIRFDIGFIGAGNTEISLDKVSRFERVDEIAGRRFDMSTIVIVDRIGEGSRIRELANEIDGTILQMSSALWAKTLDQILAERFPDDYSATFGRDANAAAIRDAVFAKLEEADLQHLLANVEA